MALDSRPFGAKAIRKNRHHHTHDHSPIRDDAGGNIAFAARCFLLGKLPRLLTVPPRQVRRPRLKIGGKRPGSNG
ncbi:MULTISPECIES: hypothetical protein [Burkholderia]|uniref:hypothetical protein n=1 Tax=Burkholderia TaxID=32008 RepID=UPI000FD8A6BD|nr:MULTISPECIES: hypothetical protein [Burkholderia]MBU9198369.1 hypothetical protein [Burkholderia gladioli]MBU9217189.1 hypothetical protein [Burkholderia gladioli]MBU9380865.1 hypothetical protein [Burkholderia gladioli]MBU9426741.1 hypothetical protein [Burkholderia gladioli]MDN7723573.1 hypothetical protein [Burkholderia gladioli]